VVCPYNGSPKDGVRRYRFGLIVKDEGIIAEPAIPSPAIFPKNANFNEFLLTKLINCERATMEGKRFQRMMHKAKKKKKKKEQMQYLIDQYKKQR